MKRSWGGAAVSLGQTFLPFLSAPGQTFRGKLSGTLYEPAGKVLPTVNSQVTTEATGLVIRSGVGIDYDTPNLALFLNAKASNGVVYGMPWRRTGTNPAAVNSSRIVDNTTRSFDAKFPTYLAINQLTRGFSSTYNSLQAIVRTKNWHRLTTQASYPWGHNQILVGYRSYRVPEQWTELHVLQAIWRHWTLVSDYNFHTGISFTITNSSSDSTGTGDKTRLAGVVGNPFAGVPHSVRKSSSSTPPVTWITSSTFQASANGTFGKEKHNQFNGSGYSTVDLAVNRLASSFGSNWCFNSNGQHIESGGCFYRSWRHD